MFEYPAKLVNVVDWDTIDVELDFGFSLKQKVRLRLADVDTEELRSPDLDKRVLALAAKRFVQEVLEDRPLIVRTLKTNKGTERKTFGRYVALVYVEEWVEQGVTEKVLINDLLIKEGFAKVWEK